MGLVQAMESLTEQVLTYYSQTGKKSKRQADPRINGIDVKRAGGNGDVEEAT